MVDVSLPTERPLSVLFLDFNSFFASVEQQERPELRGKPTIVVAVDTNSTCAIAASYEAKALGIKTLTPVYDAKNICPDLHVVEARPRMYKAYHEAIRTVAQSVLPEEKVHSIDEMSYRLIGDERDPVNARKLATRMKEAIHGKIGPCLTCSVGIAPNQFLAKMATELEKPNGLVVLEAANLPGPLLKLQLTDFCGINTRMAKRLSTAMIFTTADLYAASARELALAFGSIVGERWWYLLRGCDLREEETHRKSLSHSNVLSPELRTDNGCREVLLRLIQKASARLRSEKLWTSFMTISVSGKQKSWQADTNLPPTQDTVTLNEHFMALWPSRDFISPLKVGVVFGKLHPALEVTPSLFDENVKRVPINSAVDVVNQKFGKNTIYLAGMEKAKDHADEKIAFNKTWLFSEGKGDNDWSETVRDLLNKED